MAQCAGSVCNCAGADGEGVPSASGMAQCAGSVCNCAGADDEGVPSASGKEEGRPWRRHKDKKIISESEGRSQCTGEGQRIRCTIAIRY